MESSESSSGGDLFDGMVLFTPSVDPSPPPPPPPPAPAPAAPAAVSSDAASSHSEPLDEDLFSDLTLLVPPPPALAPSPVPSPGKPAPTAASPTQAPARQVSRKKKRAVRIGYARDAVSVDDEPQLPHLPPSSTSSLSSSASASAPLPPIFSEEVTSLPVLAVVSTESVASDLNSDPAVRPRDVIESEVEVKQQESESLIGNQEQVKEEECAVEITSKSGSDNSEKETEKEEQAEGGCDSIEQKLALVRDKILKKAELAKQRALSITAKWKELSLRRRKVEDELNEALARHKELERELEEACEAEDFESAERISNLLASVENDKNRLHLDLRSAQLEYESVESDMQGVLHLHLAAQEEAGSLLQLFAKDATEYADLVKKNAEEKASQDLEGWQTSMELLETKRLEIDVESQVILEANSGIESSIDKLVEDDRQELKLLKSKGDVLAKELADLLELVRLKKLEIAQNDAQIQEVEKKMGSVVSEFVGTQSNIKARIDNLDATKSELNLESQKLDMKKKEIDDFVFASEEKTSKLAEIASAASNEAKACQDLLDNWRNMVALIMQHRKDRIHFAELEEKSSQEIQSLRQQVAESRASLQELISKRGSIQEEIVLLKQRTSYIEKRGPELEAEKKVAAAARNFKEAGRVASEAKALNAEKEQIHIKLDKAASELEKLEEEIKTTEERIGADEGLILVKEKDGAIAGCKRLRLVAAAARAEREAALQTGDAEEAELFLREAEAAESKARDLKEIYHDLQVDNEQMSEETRLDSDSISSTAFIINLSSQHLAQMASFTLSPEN